MRDGSTRISILIGIAPINHMKIQGYDKSNAEACHSFCLQAVLFRQCDSGQDRASTAFFGLLRSYRRHPGCGVWVLGRLLFLAVTLFLSFTSFMSQM